MMFFTEAPIDVQSLEQEVRDNASGAVVTFQGVVRSDQLSGKTLDHLVFEADTSRAEESLKIILRQLGLRYPDAKAFVRQRLGPVKVGETSIFMAVSAPEKSHAFEACHFLIEQIKVHVTLHKTDVMSDGSRAQDGNSHQVLLLSDEPISIQES
jgi:molybdopterin synthase catalytic subunit